MRTIIAGSRHLGLDDVLVAMAICPWKVTEVISGGARGVDTAGEVWARINHIPIKRFPADWEKYGRYAGPRRNIQMADYAEAVVIVWDGQSRGALHMLNTAKERGMRLHLYA